MRAGSLTFKDIFLEPIGGQTVGILRNAEFKMTLAHLTELQVHLDMSHCNNTVQYIVRSQSSPDA